MCRMEHTARNTMSQIILIVEDIPLTQLWMEQAAHKAFPNAKTYCTSTLLEAGKLLRELKPSLTLVDLKLPDGTGDEFIRDAVAQQPDCINIVITLYSDENHLRACFQAGANGYILKDQSQTRIAQMLKQAMAGELPLSPAVARWVLQQFSQPAKTDASPLSKRETDVLTCIVAGSSTPDIADQLEISKFTVEDHIKNIYKKLEVSNRVEAVLAAQRLGLVDSWG